MKILTTSLCCLDTAVLSPEDLDNSTSLVEEAPEEFVVSVAAMGTEFGLKILGGCCGTDGCHLSALATRLQSPTPPDI